jgi:hypothetical protein
MRRSPKSVGSEESRTQTIEMSEPVAGTEKHISLSNGTAEKRSRRTLTIAILGDRRPLRLRRFPNRAKAGQHSGLDEPLSSP